MPRHTRAPLERHAVPREALSPGGRATSIGAPPFSRSAKTPSSGRDCSSKPRCRSSARSAPRSPRASVCRENLAPSLDGPLHRRASAAQSSPEVRSTVLPGDIAHSTKDLSWENFEKERRVAESNSAVARPTAARLVAGVRE